MRNLLLSGLLAVLGSAIHAQQPPTLPGTQPLEPNPDFSATMVAGIDRFLMREIEQSKDERARLWQRDTSSRAAYDKSVEVNRDHLRFCIGAVDDRVETVEMEIVGTTDSPGVLAETDDCVIQRVRWPALDGVHGEGVLVQPKGEPIARIILIPDADETPEQMLGLQSGAHARGLLLRSGCQILIPSLLSRDCEFSTNPRFNVATNHTHREWVYRQAFEMGRHPIGYEVQKILAAVDWMQSENQKHAAPIHVSGMGEGGLIALYSGALDRRIDSVFVGGYFAPRERVWEEPIYRNVFGLLREFGDAGIASLIAPRHLVIEASGYPEIADPPQATAKNARQNAAPGALTAPPLADVEAETARARALVGEWAGDWIKVFASGNDVRGMVAHLFDGDTLQKLAAIDRNHASAPDLPQQDYTEDNRRRQERQVRELEAFTQGLLFAAEQQRNTDFWKKAPVDSVEAMEKATAPQRERFWNEVIGRFPDPSLPANPRSRLARETDKVAIYEVTLDVWPDVFAWGWLCLPKDLKPGEKRPVVVCQHGLEGIPEDTLTEDEASKPWRAYKAFSLRLAEQGFVTFAPHNPYRGQDKFRVLQRKLNPLGKTLFSVIIGQHQSILEWLKAQPFADPARIGFYGLSYGGKSAMRIPAILTDYCLSICSGDFNEWVRKNMSNQMPMSYIHTGEYEIWEYNMGFTFNYAEMAGLIAPRPFMVERGHDDGVGLDEWVDYEYAKVRRFYNKLGIGDRTTIEHFDGPHTINGVGTFEFLRQRLDWNP